MDGLFFIGKAQFHQLATHISLYHQDNSPPFLFLGDQTLREVGLRPERFTFWNVPTMSSYLGKAVPLDIHGGYVLVDEENAMPMATSYGVLRYAYLTAAVRAREGGRWRYDFMSMNFALGVGTLAGFGTLAFGRKKVAWMRRHPLGCVSVSFLTCLLATVLTRQTLKGLGVGIIQAQNSHKKALKTLQCVDCLDDVNQYTAQQIDDLRKQKIPQQPGMPPPPEEYVKRFERNVELQCKLLSTDMDEVRLIKKYLGLNLCAVHEGLRSNPNGYTEPHGLSLLPADRARAQERAAAIEASAESSVGTGKLERGST